MISQSVVPVVSQSVVPEVSQSVVPVVSQSAEASVRKADDIFDPEFRVETPKTC